MSDAENGGLLRTVTKAYGSRPDQEMNTIGLLYGLGLLFLLIPLLPFIALFYLADWLFNHGSDVERAY